MNSKKKWILTLLLCAVATLQAQQRDSIRFSLLTCNPGPEIYELFGHTAIRYQNVTRSIDIVFNYGIFSFDTPNFEYRFAKGDADYQLGINSLEGFKRSYARRGSSVYEQELNLSFDEKVRLQELLFENYKPENRVYRYNYFYNNCTTCARDMIEKCIQGKVIYPEGAKGKTFRVIIHEFCQNSLWNELSMDYALGAEADEEIDARLQMFSPIYMYNYAANAYIESPDGTRRKLVSAETKLVDVQAPPSEPGFFLSPFVCAILFMLLNMAVAFLQIKNQKIYWGWDILIYGMQGIAGCIIAFLFFFSSQPTVGSNWMLAIFHPVALLFIPWVLWGRKKCKKDYFSLFNASFLTLFMISGLLIPQDFNLTVLPLALGLTANAVGHIFVIKK